MRRLTTTALLCFAPLAGCGEAGTVADALDRPAALEVRPVGQLNFGRLRPDTAARRTVEVRSVGEGPLEVRAAHIEGPGDVRFTVQTPLPATVPPGDTLSLVVEHPPCDAVLLGQQDICECPRGLQSALLELETNAPDAPGAIALFAQVETVGARLVTSPPARVDLRQGRTTTVTLANTGCATVRLDSVALTGPGGRGVHGGGPDIHLAGCEAWPCDLDLELCPAREADCAHSAQLNLRYDNRDGAPEELAELRLRTAGPAPAEHLLVVHATGGSTCEAPGLSLELDEAGVCLDRPQQIRAALTPETGSVQWRWLFAPNPAPELISTGDEVRFEPTIPGFYMLEARAVNVGCRVEAVSTAALNIRERCP